VSEQDGTSAGMGELAPGHAGAEELVHEDDSVIGRAFWLSLAVIAGIGVVVAVAWWAARPAPLGREGSTARVAPPKSMPRLAASPPATPFTRIDSAAGIRFERVNGADGRKLMPETLGGGGGFVDVDSDGDADLVLVDGDRWPDGPKDGARGQGVVIHLNDGKGDFTLAADTGLERPLQGMGFAAGDFDSDGRTDLAITSVDGVRLYRNASENGRVLFEDVTSAAGIDDKGWSTASLFFDADEDGDLDLLVGHYVKWSPEIDLAVDYRLTGIGRAYGPPLGFEGTQLSLWRNDGDGAFTEVAEPSGLHVKNTATGAPVAKTLGLLVDDFNGDGRPDLFVANDKTANFLFVNEGGGKFRETGAAAGVAFDRSGSATGAMGVDSARLRSPNELAIAVGNFANEPTSLFVDRGARLRFSDDALVEGVGAPSRQLLKFGTLFTDLDLDGRPDLVSANGHLEEQISVVQSSQRYEQPAQAFWHAPPGSERTFSEIPPRSLGDLAVPLVGRALAAADIDGDGDQDLLITQPAGPPALFRNDQKTGNHFVRLRLRGKAPNTEAIGARVECVTDAGTQVQWVMPSRSYLSSNELPLTFGLGGATSAKARIRWPDGTEQQLEPGIDRLVEVTQP